MKTKFILLLGVSLIAGFLIAKYTGQDEPVSAPTDQSAESEPNVEPSEDINMVPNQSDSASLEANSEESKGSAGFMEENPGSPQAQDTNQTEFNLTPALVTELEQNVADLPKQVRLTRIDGGWKVGKIQPGSLFEKTGLKEGDLVLDNELLAFRNSSPDNAELAGRTAKILDQIATY